MRHRAIENTKGAQETLTSILKLVDQIENMPVKNDVKDDVEQALDALERVRYIGLSFEAVGLTKNDTQVFSAESLQDTFRNSAEAMTLASRAFFNPGMLALLYFPAEHKYAVYTPLFASAVIPLFVAALKEIRNWRRERKEKQRAAFVESPEPSVVNWYFPECFETYGLSLALGGKWIFWKRYQNVAFLVCPNTRVCSIEKIHQTR